MKDVIKEIWQRPIHRTHISLGEFTQEYETSITIGVTGRISEHAASTPEVMESFAFNLRRDLRNHIYGEILEALPEILFEIEDVEEFLGNEPCAEPLRRAIAKLSALNDALNAGMEDQP